MQVKTNVLGYEYLAEGRMVPKVASDGRLVLTVPASSGTHGAKIVLGLDETRQLTDFLAACAAAVDHNAYE